MVDRFLRRGRKIFLHNYDNATHFIAYMIFLLKLQSSIFFFNRFIFIFLPKILTNLLGIFLFSHKFFFFIHCFSTKIFAIQHKIYILFHILFHPSFHHRPIKYNFKPPIWILNTNMTSNTRIMSNFDHLISHIRILSNNNPSFISQYSIYLECIQANCLHLIFC